MAGDPIIGIRDGVRQLARLDRRRPGRPRRVFGADQHGYRVSRASAADVARLEERAGATLPRDFRRFLLVVGSGAGPYHGIYSPGEITSELESLRIEADHVGQPWPRPALPFPISREQAAAAVAEHAPIPAAVLLDGCLIIGHQGSGTQWTVLAISGPTAGTVWDLGWCTGRDAEWWPARVPPTVPGVERPRVDLPRPPSFLEWFRAWIEMARSGLLAADASPS